MPIGYWSGTKMKEANCQWDLRCDELTKVHKNKHILFIGDSFCAGVGLEKEETWAYKVYKKISETEMVDGYYNIGISGSSITEAIDQFYKYCFHYGNPDVVFFVLSDPIREERHCNLSEPFRLENIAGFIQRMYFYLEMYCKTNSIKLFSFSWTTIMSDDLREYSSNQPTGWRGEPIQDYWTKTSIQSSKMINLNDILNENKTFYSYKFHDMMKKVFEYDKKSNNKEKSIWASDNSHAGTSFHDYWAELMYDAYTKSIDQTE